MWFSQNQAYIKLYAQRGAITVSNWSGTFLVSDMSGTPFDPLVTSTITANSLTSFNYTGPAWYADPAVQWGLTSNGLFGVDSTTLNTDKFNPWSQIVGHSYAITSAVYDTRNLIGGGYLSGTGAGQISFSVATPEPGTMMLLGSGVLAFGLSRFRRRKEMANFA